MYRWMDEWMDGMDGMDGMDNGWMGWIMNGWDG